MDTKDITADLSNYPFLLAHKVELSELSLKSKQVMKSVEVLNLMERRKSCLHATVHDYLIKQRKTPAGLILTGALQRLFKMC